MWFTLISYVCVFELLALSALMVYRHRLAWKTIVFLANVTLLVGWALTISLAFRAQDAEAAAFHIRLCTMLGMIMPGFFYCLLESIRKEADPQRSMWRSLMIGLTPSILFGILPWTPWYMTGATIVPGGVPAPQPGAFFALPSTYLILTSLLVTFLGYKTSYRYNGFTRVEIQYVISIAMFWVAVAGVLTFIPFVFKESRFVVLALVPGLIMPIHVAHALTTTKITDVALFVENVVYYGVTFCCLTLLYGVLWLMAAEANAPDIGHFLGFFGATLLAPAIRQKTETWLQGWFKTSRITTEVVNQIAERMLASHPDHICHILAEHLQIPSMLLLTDADALRQIQPATSTLLRWDASHPVTRLQNQNEGVSSVFVLRRSAHPLHQAAAQELEQLQMELFIPLQWGNMTLGAVLLGHRPTNKPFSNQEQKALQLLARYMAIVLETRRLYDQMLQTSRINTLGTLTTGIAHEINNPLVSLKNMTQMLQEEPSNPEVVKSFLSICPSEISKIERLVASLREAISPQSTTVEVMPITKPLHQAIKVLEPKLKSCQVETEKVQANCRVEASPDALQTVFLHLLLNAIQAGATKIQISAQSFRERVTCQVLDNGQGIPKENLPKVFEPFFTTHADATGLGLTSCFQIVHQLKGQIRIESLEGLGTNVTFELPAYQRH